MSNLKELDPFIAVCLVMSNDDILDSNLNLIFSQIFQNDRPLIDLPNLVWTKMALILSHGSISGFSGKHKKLLFTMCNTIPMCRHLTTFRPSLDLQVWLDLQKEQSALMNFLELYEKLSTSEKNEFDLENDAENCARELHNICSSLQKWHFFIAEYFLVFLQMQMPVNVALTLFLMTDGREENLKQKYEPPLYQIYTKTQKRFNLIKKR